MSPRQQQAKAGGKGKICGLRRPWSQGARRFIEEFTRMMLVYVAILSIIQGAAELLPVSSSAHVAVAAKLMGLDPSSPEMTLLMVMLHTGTMFAVIVYFWPAWRTTYFASRPQFREHAKLLILATALTVLIGGALIKGIEHVFLRHAAKAEIELLFKELWLIALALLAAGALILYAGLRTQGGQSTARPLQTRSAAWIGAIQGLCLPFRGFSRSGATISTGLLCDAARRPVEEFSFALAVILTPLAIGRELLRLREFHHAGAIHGSMLRLLAPSAFGLIFSFLAGLLALAWLSRWLEKGRWHYFGYYCLGAALVVAYLYHKGY